MKKINTINEKDTKNQLRWITGGMGEIFAKSRGGEEGLLAYIKETYKHLNKHGRDILLFELEDVKHDLQHRIDSLQKKIDVIIEMGDKE